MRKSWMARDSSTPDTGQVLHLNAEVYPTTGLIESPNAELQAEANRLNALMKLETHKFWRQKLLPKFSQKQCSMLQPIQLNPVILRAVWPAWIVSFIDAPQDSLFNGSCTWVRPPRRRTRQRRHQECHVMRKQKQNWLTPWALTLNLLRTSKGGRTRINWHEKQKAWWSQPRSGLSCDQTVIMLLVMAKTARQSYVSLS